MHASIFSEYLLLYVLASFDKSNKPIRATTVCVNQNRAARWMIMFHIQILAQIQTAIIVVVRKSSDVTYALQLITRFKAFVIFIVSSLSTSDSNTTSRGQTFCYNSQNTGQNNPCCDSDSSCINSQCVKNPIIATITAQNTIQFTTLVTSTIQNTNQFTTTVFTTVNPSAVTIYTTTVIYITSNVFNTFTNQVTSQGAIQTIFSPTITTTYTILVSSTRSVTDAATANKDASVVYVTNVDDSTLTITSTITASQSVTTTSTITTTSGTTVKSTLTVDQILGATKTTTMYVHIFCSLCFTLLIYCNS